MVAATLSTGESTAELVLGIIGFCTALLVILSPIPTFKAISTTHEVGETKPYPFLAILFNSGIWVIFGIPAMIKLSQPIHHGVADWLGVPLMGANCFGVIAELIYVGIYLRYAVDDRCYPGIALFGCGGTFTVVLGVLFGLKLSRTFVGYIAMISGIAMYAIPLYSTYRAWKANDAAQISAFQASASFLNGVVWTAYASIDHIRAFVFFPSVTAIICAGVQLYVWAYLKRKARIAAELAEAARIAAELAEAARIAAELAEAQRRERELGAGNDGDRPEPSGEVRDLEPGLAAVKAGGSVEMTEQVHGRRAAVHDLESGSGNGGAGAGGGGAAATAQQVAHKIPQIVAAEHTDVPVPANTAITGGGGDAQGVGAAGAHDPVLPVLAAGGVEEGESSSKDTGKDGGKEDGGGGRGAAVKSAEDDEDDPYAEEFQA